MLAGPAAACYVQPVKCLPLGVLCGAALCLVGACKSDETSTTVRRLIGTDGGQITSHDGVLTLLFLPGALDQEEEIVIAPSDTPPRIFGPAYRVRPDVDLNVAAEVTYRRVLPNDPTGTAVAAIRRADFSAGAANWVPLPRTELDERNDLVGGIDTEISLFYAMIEDADPDIATGSTTATTMETGDETTVGMPTTSGPMTDTSDADDTEVGPLSHAADIQPIWNDSCASSDICHVAGGTAPDLETGAYDNIVGVGSAFAAAELIVAGDASASYLMHKIDATHDLETNFGGCGCAGIGGPMPAGADLLPISTRDLVRDWINGGAMP